MSTKSIDESLFGLIRRQLLCLFFLNPEQSYYLLELINILRTGRGGVQREVANLVESGIITREKSGMKVFFSLAEDCIVTDEMQKLLRKFVDYEGMLSQAVRDYGASIRTAVMSIEGEEGSFNLLVSFDGDSDEFRMEIERTELLTGIEIVLSTVQPHELKAYIRNSEAPWISSGKWKLLAGTTDDLIPGEIDKESGIREPDLFTGTGFSW
jgi:predicted transcriptional regulator